MFFLSSLSKRNSRVSGLWTRFCGMIPPLSIPFLSPNSHPSRPVSENEVLHERVKSATTPSGLRCISRELFEPLSSVSIVFSTRHLQALGYRNNESRRYFNVLQNLLFDPEKEDVKSLQNMGVRLVERVEREFFTINAVLMREDVPSFFKRMGKLLRPRRILPEELEFTKKMVLWEGSSMFEDPTSLLPQISMSCAYGSQDLKDSLVPFPRVDDEYLADMDTKKVEKFFRNIMQPSHIAVSSLSTGPISTLEDLVERHLIPSLKEWDPPVIRTENRMGAVYQPTVWKHEHLDRSLRQGEHIPPLSHMLIGFPSVGISHEEKYVPFVVRFLLGGGSSFSIGGPGRGMHSRLYQNLLCVHPWIESAFGMVEAGAEEGLIGVMGSAPHEYAPQLTVELLQEWLRLTFDRVSDEELERAKNQLQVQTMQTMEDRANLCDEMGREILVLHEEFSPESMRHSIEQVTAEQVQQCMRNASLSDPIIGCYGSVNHIADDTPAKLGEVIRHSLQLG
uniref:Mitochondrial processing peptidase A subunit n=1 Tax=Stygiella incarcerata TaxID=1712417 RepID=A0A192ZIY1_9EUKA|nr:mitochondrial processing peptidase A subunit [Stygiella incarcerata]